MEMSSSDLLDPSLLDFLPMLRLELDRHIAIWLQAMCERYRKTATTRWSNPELDKMDSHLLEASEEETLRQLYHVVSNRIDCNFDTTINLLEELPLLSGPVGRLIFQQVLMGIGIEGAALRCTRILVPWRAPYHTMGEKRSFVDDNWGYFTNFKNDEWVKSRYAQAVNAYPGILEETMVSGHHVSIGRRRQTHGRVRHGQPGAGLFVFVGRRICAISIIIRTS